MNAARSNAVVRDHAAAASFAAAIARRASSRDPRGTSPSVSPVAGDSAVNVSPDSAPVQAPATNISVAKLGPPAIDVRLQLVVQPRVHRRLVVLLECLLPDLVRARGCVVAALSHPALVVLRRRE